MYKLFVLLVFFIAPAYQINATVIYSFQNASKVDPVGWQFSTSSFVTGFLGVYASQMASCTLNCYMGADAYAVTMHPWQVSGGNGDFLSYLSAADGPQNAFFDYFASGTFSTPGTYNDFGDELTIVQTPEPATESLIYLAIFASMILRPIRIYFADFSAAQKAQT